MDERILQEILSVLRATLDEERIYREAQTARIQRMEETLKEMIEPLMNHPLLRGFLG